MEKEEKISQDYLTGFNEGYTIAKYNPELAGQLANVTQDNLRGTGFQQGHEQFLKEQTKERLPSWVKGDRSERNSVVPDKNIEKGKNMDIEPEP
jgi:hypothetical protein